MNLIVTFLTVYFDKPLIKPLFFLIPYCQIVGQFVFLLDFSPTTTSLYLGRVANYTVACVGVKLKKKKKTPLSHTSSVEQMFELNKSMLYCYVTTVCLYIIWPHHIT